MDRFYQIVPSARAHDAVGRMALGVQHQTAEMGFRSLIFTERQRSFFGGPLRRGLLHASPSWSNAPSPAFSFYHHSTGSVAAERFLQWPAAHRTVFYHNITPVELLSGKSAEHAQWGREQLKTLARESDVLVGFSAFSCNELATLGGRHVEQLPYYVWSRGEARSRVAPNQTDEPLILIVGRVEPHKRVAEGVQAFLKLRVQVPRARLAIVGPVRGHTAYVDSIIELIRPQAGIQLLGKVSNRRLAQIYRRASALLVLSAHEGFCVPIVEAMKAGLPVVAYAGTAIPETLGKGGILVNTIDPGVVADALESVLSSSEVARTLFANQAMELSRFTPEKFREGLQNLLT